MKTAAVVTLGLVASAQGFAPAAQGRPSTQRDALFDRILGMDLFEPVKDQNNYGARTKKNLKQGKISAGSSYVPAGLTADAYNKIREQEASKKKANYERNVKKAGVFIDFTDWYLKRGTDTNQAWAKSASLGHRMAKTKYDWSGQVSDDSRKWVKEAK